MKQEHTLGMNRQLYHIKKETFLGGGAAPTAYGGSHSYSNIRSEPRLPPIPQLTAVPDSQPTEWARD